MGQVQIPQLFAFDALGRGAVGCVGLRCGDFQLPCEVEEKILSLQQRKLDLANDLVTSDESILRTLSEDEVLDLLS